MKITIECTEKEIADLVSEVQNQQLSRVNANDIAKELAEKLRKTLEVI